MRIRVSAMLVALWLALVATTSAQETTGTLTGKLTDDQGLALPGVTVTVTGGQGVRTFVTDGEGLFRASFLVPGTYDVRGELSGFKAVEQKAVPVSLGQTTAITLKLEVGGITETVLGHGRNHHRQHQFDDDRRGAVERDAGDGARGPPLHRHAVSRARRQQRRVSGPRQPVGVRRFRARQPLRRRRRERDQHRLRRRRLVLGDLRIARQRDAVRLHQGSADQDRRLRGRVRPVARRRGQRRDQERQQHPAWLVLRLHTAAGARSPVEDLPVGERHRQHRRHVALGCRRRSRLPAASRQAVRVCRDQPGVGEAHVRRAGRVPARISRQRRS